MGSTSYASNATYHVSGQPLRHDLGNGRFYEATFNDRHLRTEHHYSYGFVWQMSYDAMGRITQIDDLFDSK